MVGNLANNLEVEQTSRPILRDCLRSLVLTTVSWGGEEKGDWLKRGTSGCLSPFSGQTTSKHGQTLFARVQRVSVGSVRGYDSPHTIPVGIGIISQS